VDVFLLILALLNHGKKRLIYLKWQKGVKTGSGHDAMNGLYLFRILLIPIQLNMCNYNNKVIEKKIFDQRW
jgi:hypothetical protein